MFNPFRRKHARIRLTALHDVAFFPLDPLFDQPLAVSNLSEGGVGFLVATSPLDRDETESESFPWPSVGNYINGELRLKGQTYLINLRIAFKGSESVGCAFGEVPKDFKAALSRYFEVELGALKMKRVDSKQIKATPDGTPHWIFGPNNCELYFVTDAQGLVRFNLSFFANYVEGGRDKGVKFGQVKQSDLEDDELKYKASDLIHWQDPVEISKNPLSALALAFIENVETLTAEERQAFRSCLKA